MSETASVSSASAPSSGGQVSQASQGAPATQTQQASSQPSQSSQGQTTPQARETTKPEAPQKRYLEADHEDALVKVKIDGQEQELTIKELKRLNSLEKASQKRMQEAALEAKRAKAFLQSLEQNPNEALERLLGERFDTLAEERLARKYELMQMSPEQRENLRLKSELEARQKAEFESKKSVIEEIKKLSDKVPENLEKYSREDLANYRDHLNSVNAQAQEALQNEMIGAWEETKLPKHRAWANWMAQEMIAHEKRTGEPLQAKEAAAKVKADWLKFNQQILGQMDAQAIHDFLGKEIVQRLIDHKIQGVTDQAAQGFQRQAPTQSASQEPKKYLNQAEWRKAMGIG